jgi:hypothetical protein
MTTLASSVSEASSLLMTLESSFMSVIGLYYRPLGKSIQQTHTSNQLRHYQIFDACHISVICISAPVRLSVAVNKYILFISDWTFFLELRHLSVSMDKLHLTGQNLGRVFNSRSGREYAIHSCCYWARLHDLNLETRPKQLLGSLPLDIALPAVRYDKHKKLTQTEVSCMHF